MGETRVNLRHLLEDIRDSYPNPLEEAIITELIANAFDAGASKIRFLTKPDLRRLTIVDNGKGMKDQNFEEYHDIAATTKIRGKGIGFAGVGVKLALLIAEEVITETKSGSFHKATRWKLETAQRAPWEYIEPKGLVSSFSGTAVSIILRDQDSLLLRGSFIERVIQTHFYPILDEEFMNRILIKVYKNGMAFEINEKRINLVEEEGPFQKKPFLVRITKGGKPIGIGFLSKSKEELPEDQRGMAISTYGKVIKRGWDWVGIAPRNPMCLTGVVEVPQLSEILTINKADFLKDTTSLQKYYRYRKAIQEAIKPILRDLGEIITPREKPERVLRPLEKEMERLLGNMLNEFPELSPLLGRRRMGEPVEGIIPDSGSPPIGTLVEGVEAMTGTHGGGGEGSGIEATEGELEGERISPADEPIEQGHRYEGRRRRPGVMLNFGDNPERQELGWLSENTIWINKGHPAYQRAMDSGAENYHIVLSVAWVLSNYLETEKSPQMFINRFLSNWGSS